MTTPLRGVRRAGSTALLAELADLDDVLALRAALERDRPVGVRELIAAARTLLVTYDPAVTGHDGLSRTLAERADALPAQGGAVTPSTDYDTLVVPVRYDGPDLADVAELTGLTVREVIERHTTPLYTVAFAGFAPGFGYLTGTDPVLRLPRRSEPRTAVPSGSVAVAGGFTGVYPRSSPGGWQLLGSTDAPLWQEDRTPPALLLPGRTVRFEETT
ncbi:5-oxoprolinase subunit B family protein [Streptomyces cavernicola]|uniref:Allophanate hydrolase subunit 1 n=1 Tax=Streptomyces cavernicola TaxID=3043613 RepID=A0ABT6SAD7_9ACTN|nr:allophanate hydrolase subunit 1 [Streptomyces sp. B-S-A6]MDI3404749.1 allophanate hydrolase subunit 1 [Streptomyces sp. B-S-A6]